MNVLVVAAHPDDEVLGCGGTIGRLAAEGRTVHVGILAEGITSRTSASDNAESREALSALGNAAKAAAGVLGVASIDLQHFPDNRLDSVDSLDITKTVERWIETIQPETVLTHHAGDVNVDHRRIHEAVVTACRPQPRHCVRRLLFFEGASSTEWQPPGSAPPFVPNVFVDISDFLDRKLAALDVYKAEMRPWPHARSLEAVSHQARWRGASVGVEAAEAFILGRELVF